ncbi:KATIP-like protein [Mya arenaria]|uniref:KATIP-like protein n=1 Tax=Mya arenaria TaxID=6604 RepID=A0ABY7DIF4_MYAAR|nr:KATIP-like protein [Mya arenaria]
MNTVGEFSTSLGSSFAQLSETTGYTPNPGAWAKMQLQQDKQQRQAEKKQSKTRKRKLWRQSGPPAVVASNPALAMYQISEGDEEEEARLASLSRENSRLRKKDSGPVKVVLSRENSRLRRDSGVKMVAEETEEMAEVLDDGEPSVPNIVISEDGEPTQEEYCNSEPKTDTNHLDTLKLPTFKPNTARMFPVQDSFTYFPPKHKKHKAIEKTNDKTTLIDFPKYTHIRVPKHSLIVTHVSQESFDSPLSLPRILQPKKLGQQRKPVKFSLSQSVQIMKSKSRKKWQFGSLEEPLNFFIVPQSASSSATRNTDESKFSNTTSSKSISRPTQSLEDIRKQALKGLNCYENVLKETKVYNSEHLTENKGDNSINEMNTKGDNEHSKSNTRQHDGSYGIREGNLVTSRFPVLKQGGTQAEDGAGLGDTLKRKKWVLPHFWPKQQPHADGPIKSSQPPGKMRGTKTPRNVESRPPIPHRKSEEKNSRKSMVEKALERPAAPAISVATEPVVMDTGKRESEGELDDTLKAGSTTISSSVSVASSQDDMPMLQKLKDMNKKEQTSSRKKDVPRWLKQEDIAKSFESPTESVEMRAKKPAEVRTQRPGPPPTQKEINMLIDEEMSQFPENKKGAVQPEPAGDKPDGSTTPMQRIEKNRSKWREGPGLNLEESWGSLSQFNKCQRGRLSLDMDDDVLDEYINKAAKLAGLPSEPAIPEEASQTPLTQMVVDSDDEDFVIPELPYGRELVINIRSTWGDKHYVGFTGIEVFADPSDINMLPEYNKDPRVVGNLIDGTNRTRDDIHMWLAPFTQGQDHWVYCTLDKPCKIALIRIWNYNKSRIHSYRGVKDVIMALDSTVIFRGEIARACGGIEGGTEAFGDTILFTTDESILDLVSQHDAAYEGEMLDDDEPFDVERPSTADAGDEKGRPLTRAVGNIKQMERELTVFEYEGNMMAYRGHNGTNVTTSDEHMWLVPFVEGENHTLTIDFDQKVLVAGLRVWNYNKSKEDTYRGVRIVHVAIDGKPVSPPEGFLVRKGPGNCHFDFAQELSFSPQSWNTGGMLSALGTWGDAYYVGLNGIELYDGSLKMINLTENNISAFPGSVNMLEKMQNDVRTPEKLIDGVNDTTDGGHMWLAPILPNILNRVYVIFDQPTTISMIKIWNYSKTASRGAKDFALLVDDLLVYNGTLQGVPTGARGILPTCDAPQPYHTILFTNNKDILRKEKHTVINQQTDEQDVQMTNEKKIVSHYTDPKKAQSGKPVDQKMRPKTSVIHSKKR